MAGGRGCALYVAGALGIVAIAGCGGGGGSPPGAAPATQSIPVAASAAGGSGTQLVTPTPGTAVIVPGTAAAAAGIRGTTVYAHQSGDVWAFGEDVGVLFPAPISPGAYSVTVAPAPSGGVEVVNPAQADAPAAALRNLLQLRWNKLPGQTYTVTVTKGTAAPVATVTVRAPSAAPSPQPPILSKRTDPYYYGSLEHSVPPASLKLPNSGDIDPTTLQALVGIGVHFVRFGPTPDEVAAYATGAQSRQNYSFASTDPTIDALHAANITVLYVIDAAAAPPWANPNTGGDARPLFETPALYAEYCGGIATHLAASLPWVTRVEIGTNEPNFAANWQNDQAVLDGLPQYDDATGYGFALYAKACYAAIKAVAPQIEVVAPGITVGSNAYSSFAFVDHMYAAGCRVGVCFDILSLHSYPWLDPGYPTDQPFMDNLLGSGAGPGTLLSYRALQQRAVADGEAALPPVMITEMGYSRYPDDPRAVDPNVQAYYTSEAFNSYLSDPTVRGVVYADILQHEAVPSIFAGIAAIEGGVLEPVGRVYRTFATF